MDGHLQKPVLISYRVNHNVPQEKHLLIAQKNKSVQ